MKWINRSCSLALAGAAVLSVARARAQQAALFKTLVASVPVGTYNWAVSPNGKLLVQSIGTETYVYNLVTGHSTKLIDGGSNDFRDFGWSPKSDMIAWTRGVAGPYDHKTLYIWAMAVDPNTGAGRGPAQRVSVGNGRFPVFSSDGRSIAYTREPATAPYHEGAVWPTGGDLVIVPSAGGPERTVAHVDGEVWPVCWSLDGKSIMIQSQTNPITGPTSFNTERLLKVQVDNSAVNVIRADDPYVFGRTADCRHFAVTPVDTNKKTATLIDASGKDEDRFALPVGYRTLHTDGPGFLGDSALVVEVWSYSRDSNESRQIKTGSLVVVDLKALLARAALRAPRK